MNLRAFTTFFTTYRQVLLVTMFALCFFATSTLPAFAQASEDPFGIMSGIAALFYGIALAIGGLVAGLGGMLLDLSFYHVVLSFGNLAHPGGGIGAGIKELWIVVRDIFNILFIFGFIYIGIKTILDAEDSGTRKTLGLLIIAALMINFSLYITQVIVDFTNIAATQIFNQVIDGDAFGIQAQNATAASLTDSLLSIGTNSITGAFLDVTLITTFFAEAPKEMDTFKIFGFSIFMMIFLIVAGIVFAMGAFLLIARFIALIIYMILSPVMFAGFILPSLAGYQKKWWGGFLKQAFFAPAFVFMLYLSLIILEKMRAALNISGDTKFTSMVAKGTEMTTDLFTLIMFLVVAIGFLYASIKVGQMMGIAGAAGSIKALDAMGKGARGAIQGAAYRSTVGFGLNKVVGGIDALDRAAENGSKRAKFARTIMGGEATRRAVENASNYGAGGLGREALEKDNKARAQRATRGNQIEKINKAIKAGSDSDDSEVRIKMERAVQDASSSQIVDMIKGDDKDNVQSVAGLLSESQMKAVMDDKDIDDATKTAMSEARSKQIETKLKKNPKFGTSPDEPKELELEAVIGKADIVDLKALGFEKARDHAGKLSAKQIEDWKDLTPTEKAQLKDARKKAHKKEFDDDADKFFGRITNDEERSKLSDEILTDEKSVKYLNTNVLSKIVDNGGITEKHREIIKENVLAAYRPDGATPDHDKMIKFAEWFEKNNLGQRY